MRSSKYRLLTAAAISVSLSVVIAPEFAKADTAAEEAAHRVNIAGRQRMLTQRIAKAACFAARDISAATYRDQLNDAYALFEASQEALRFGSFEMNLKRELKPWVIAAQEPVQVAWSEYKEPLNKIMADETVAVSDVIDLQDLSLNVLKLANAAVYKTAYAYANDSEKVSLSHTITVDIAGRQRMFSQKMMKELCLIGIDTEAAHLRDSLAETTKLFDLSLTALQDGLAEAGVMAAPNDKIANGLAAVASDWAELKTITDAVLSGEPLTVDQLVAADQTAESLLTEMNATVALYEDIDTAM